MANFILEGIYFYSGFMFFYNLERNGKMPGSSQEIRYINRDENTHLWLFRNLIRELQKEEADVFTDELINELRLMMKTGVEHEINWGNYVIGENIQLFDSKNCIIHTTEERKVVVQGLDGYIVAEKDDTLLICKLSEEQRIKQFSGE